MDDAITRVEMIKGIRSIFTTTINAQDFNLCMQLSFNICFKILKNIKRIRFILKQIYSSEFRKLINENKIVSKVICRNNGS